ncbi:MAG: general secretion pathway protein GspB [Gammaproteobacteria bacterium]
MSLILDALRRADRSRERDVGRRITQAMPPRARPRATRVALLTALVLVVAASISGWFARPLLDSPAEAPEPPPRLVEVTPQVRGSSLAEISVPARAVAGTPTRPPAPLLSTLTAAVRSSVPPLTVNAHVWSDEPTKRFVMLNGRMYRDGEIVQDGLRLVAVLVDGAELEWRGIRFRVPAQ